MTLVEELKPNQVQAKPESLAESNITIYRQELRKLHSALELYLGISKQSDGLEPGEDVKVTTFAERNSSDQRSLFIDQVTDLICLMTQITNLDTQVRTIDPRRAEIRTRLQQELTKLNTRAFSSLIEPSGRDFSQMLVQLFDDYLLVVEAVMTDYDKQESRLFGLLRGKPDVDKKQNVSSHTADLLQTHYQRLQELFARVAGKTL